MAEVRSDWVFSPDEIVVTEAVLGRGAFGEVRIAKWRNIDVACKSLHSFEAEDGIQVENEGWLQEIDTLSKLRHPNLVLFLGICESQNNSPAMILTELLPCSLYDVLEIRKSRLELPDILDIALDIGNGLDYLHRHKPPIVHRDISSKNILIGGTHVKIADLGQAKIFAGTQTLSRQTGMPGAMAYAAPEVLTGKYSAKIDIFSTGILFVHMCGGEYPRIDRREDQISKACDQRPLLEGLITSMVKFQPEQRPTAVDVCQALEAFRNNDRYYPLARRTQPEKDLGILGRQWMHSEITKQCEEVGTELRRTKSLLTAEEERWRHEAGKVDGINEQLNAAQQTIREKEDKFVNLQADLRVKQSALNELRAQHEDCKLQMGLMGTDLQKMKSTIQNYELQMAQQHQEMSMAKDAIAQYQDQLQLNTAMLESSRRSEQEVSKQSAQVKLQLDMQVEYVRDLETRLEQALTRWRIEKDNLREETAKNAKLNAQSAAVADQNSRHAVELERYQIRLKQYEELPMPEIKARIKDLQSDAMASREEVQILLEQRDQWNDLEANLNQTVSDYKHYLEEKTVSLATREEELESCRKQLSEATLEKTDLATTAESHSQRISDLEQELSVVKASEDDLQTKLMSVELALKKEKQQVQIMRDVQHTMSMASGTAISTGTDTGSGNVHGVGGVINASSTNVLANQAASSAVVVGSNGVVEQDGDGGGGEVLGAGPAIGDPEQRDHHQHQEIDGYILQQDSLIESIESASQQILDVDDDPPLPLMSSIVGSVSEQARMESISSTILEKAMTDMGVKHMVNSISEKNDGVNGLMEVMQKMRSDARVVWRGARALRDLLLKDDALKKACYGDNIEQWLLPLMDEYAQSNTVQGHCMRLIGALAFGNDRFRRKAGESGVMRTIVNALENHTEDETVLLHVSTAITNLTHNSMENRHRFVELNGIDLYVRLMVQFKESAKLQRQACWTVLTLCGTDDISRQVAQRGGDSAIMNAMLVHRYDAGVQQFGCWALSNLALSGEEVARRMKKKGAVEVCRIALESHPKNPDVIRQARNAIGSFSPIPSTSSPSNNNDNNNNNNNGINRSNQSNHRDANLASTRPSSAKLEQATGSDSTTGIILNSNSMSAF